LDDAAYDANMRSAASLSLSEAADALPAGPDRGNGDASSGTDDDSDAEVADVQVLLDTPDIAGAADLPRQAHGGRNNVAQRTRSWDESVEEGMAKIDADATADDAAGAKR
jgi:hypothetical protein